MHSLLIAAVLLAASGPMSPNDTEPIAFACEDVVEVSYSSDLDATQWLSLGWGGLPFRHGYGEYDRRHAWRDRGRTNDTLAPLAIMLPDSLRTEKDWPAGTLEIVCGDGRRVDVDLPAFTDVPGIGFLDREGRRFAGGVWVRSDGAAYLDPQFTRPAS
jgi:hypothetical protein